MSALSTVSLMTAVKSSENLNLEFTSNLNYDYLYDQNHLTCFFYETNANLGFQDVNVLYSKITNSACVIVKKITPKG